MMNDIFKGFRTEELCMRYGGGEILSNISCTIEMDRNWAITGVSGCGKSTLLRLLSGLEAPTSGTVYLNGRAVSANGEILCPASERHISMVFQDLALWPNLTAEENVLLGIKERTNARRLAKESLELCGVLSMAEKYPGEMSGGEQQRLALARALAARPEFLFLDEPFNGLDLSIRNSIIESIKDLSAREGVTIILVSHDPYEVVSLCHSMIVLENGVVAEQGDVRYLFETPRSEVMKSFALYINRLQDAF